MSEDITEQQVVEMPGGQLAIASIIDERYARLINLKHEQKTRKEMIDDRYAEGGELEALDAQIKELQSRRKEILINKGQDMQIMELENAYETAKTEIKGLQEEFSMSLITYISTKGTNKITLGDQEFIITQDAKLKKVS